MVVQFGKLLRAVEIANILGISKSYTYLLINRGDIECVRFGKSVRVEEYALDKFIANNSQKPGVK